MSTATENKAAEGGPVTEPQRVLLLSKAGFSTRRIADLLSLSQSTVTRRLREASQIEVGIRWRRLGLTVMFTLLTACAVTLTAAVASYVWGG